MGWIIFAIFILMNYLLFVNDPNNIDSKSYKRIIGAFVLSLFCILFAYFYVIPNWPTPEPLTPEEFAHASTKGRGKGGLLVLLFQYLPYAMIVWSGIISYISIHNIRFYRKNYLKKS